MASGPLRKAAAGLRLARIRPTPDWAIRVSNRTPAKRTGRLLQSVPPALIVYEMKRLGRDAAERTALADHLTAHGLALEMLAGPLPGIYEPTGRVRGCLRAHQWPFVREVREVRSASTVSGVWSGRPRVRRSSRPPGLTTLYSKT